MRYQDIVRQYLAVRAASSREWRVSPSLVMCVELDTAPDAFGAMAVAASSTRLRRAPEFMRVTFFRRHESDGRAVFLGWSDANEHPELSRVSDEERATIAQHRIVMDRWIAGNGDLLPPSTSKAIGDWLQKKR
jgi:hypothetical protein